MSWKKKGCIFVGAVFALLLLAGAIGLWYVDRRYGAVFAAPRVEHLQTTDAKPSIRFVVDPSKASKQLRGVVNELAPWGVPPWLVDAFLPYAFSVIVESDNESARINLEVLLNEQRLGPIIVTQLDRANVTSRFDEISWEEEGFTMPERGRITVTGSVSMDPQAREDAFLQWGRSLVQTPPPLEGGHFVEAVGDNREGAAWLVGASLMKAYNYNLDEHAREVADGVSLASFQFLTEIRMVADLIGDDAARLRLTMDVIPEHRNKLAVINVKAFLDDVFENLSTNFEEYHGIPFKGESRWEETTLVFEYELGGVRETLERIIDGTLFQGERPEEPNQRVIRRTTSASGPRGRD